MGIKNDTAQERHILTKNENGDDYKSRVISRDLHDLWDDFCQGDETAYIVIYESYFELLFNFGLQLCRNVELVEDTIQDVFIDLRIKRKGLPKIKYSLKHYLITVFRNKLYRYFENERRLNQLHMVADAETFEFTLPAESVMVANQEQDDLIKKLNNATKSLTAKERQAIYYYYYLNMTYEEVRDLLNLKSAKIARNLVYRALKHLRKLFLFIVLFLFSLF